jgi:hypothetical protein
MESIRKLIRLLKACPSKQLGMVRTSVPSMSQFE